MELGSSIKKVAALLQPHNVVVAGASDRVGSWPATVWRTLREHRFPGPIYALNPNRAKVGEEPCYPDFQSLPERPDHIVMLVPSPAVPGLLRAGAAAGARSATIYSSGFGETGTSEGWELGRQLAEIIEQTEIAVSGPNCTGNISAKSRLVTMVDHRALTVRPGPVALVGQSGGVLLYANHVLSDRGIQIGYLVSSGNEIGLTCADYIAFFAQEPSVKVIFCYIESIRDPERFKEACASAQRAGKPIVAFKLGASEAGRKAAMTHTGALAGNAEIFDAIAGERGVIRVDSLDDAIEIIELVVNVGVPMGARVGALTLSGAYCGILRDGAAGSALEFPPLAPQTDARLRSILSVGSSVANPADGGFSVLTSVENYIAAIEAIYDDPNIDTLLLQAELPREAGMAAQWEERFRRINEIAARREKKVIIVSMYSRVFTDYTRSLRAELSNLAFVLETRKTVRAISHLVRWSERARRVSDCPKQPARAFRKPDATVARLQAFMERTAGEMTVALNEPESKDLLRRYGIATAEEAWVTSPEEALEAAERIGYPVVLKAVSRKLLHKSDLGALVLDIDGPDAIRRAFDSIDRRLEQAGLTASRDGTLVCQQVSNGMELVLGIQRDPEMGLAIMVGSGGVLLELVRDVAFSAVPLNLDQAFGLLSQTRASRILRGYRGGKVYDIDAVANAIVALGNMAVDLGEIIESVDINPFRCFPSGQGGLALDALVVLKRATPPEISLGPTAIRM